MEVPETTIDSASSSNLTEASEERTVIRRTASLCPECKTLLPAEVVEVNGSVYIERRCERHGATTTLLSSDAAHYRNALAFDRPGVPPQGFNGDVANGCPFDCGLCPDHEQHTCLAILEITQRCNLECPVCFTESSPFTAGELSMAEVRAAIDNYVACEANPQVLMVSGGEPTLHPRVLDVVRYAHEAGIQYVTLNTNGIRLADAGFAEALKEAGAYIYLQFDGFTPATSIGMRGEDLVEVKRAALENCSEVGLDVILVPTLYRGVNEDEVGDIVRFAMREEAVRGVMFQPATFTGRHPPADPLDRVTIPEVIQRIEQQTDGMLLASDFTPIPCPFPTSSAATYVYVKDDEVLPISRLVDVEEYLSHLVNRVFPDPGDESVLGALESLWSSSAVPGTESVLTDFCMACGLSVDLDALRRRVKLVGVFAFCDAYNFDIACARKCCIHEILPDRIIPFCNYNILYRDRGGEC